MAGSIRLRATLDGDIAEVKALMRHPMETGQRKDADGQPIAAHFISDVTAVSGDRTVLQCHWGAAVSQNPFLGFKFSGAKVGDIVKVSWLDNKGETGEGEVAIR